MPSFANVVAALLGSLVFGAVGAEICLWFRGVAAVSTQTWIPVAAALLGAVVAPYFAEYLKANYYAPRFRLVAGDGPRFHVATRIAPLRGTTAISDAIYHYYRIGVSNVGRSEARRCEAILESIWFERNDKWFRLGFWQPDALLWSGDLENSGVRDINRDREVFLDLGSVATEAGWQLLQRGAAQVDWPGGSGPRFVLALKSRYRAQPSALTRGRYILSVRLHGSNTASVAIFVRLDFLADNYEAVRVAGVMGTDIPGVQVHAVSSLPSAFKTLNTFLDILQVQSDNFSQPVVVED